MNDISARPSDRAGGLRPEPRAASQPEALIPRARWELGYVPDAATARVTIYGYDGRAHPGNSNYDPLEGFGVHLCGQTDDGEQPTTVANYPMRDEAEAQSLWELARSVAECSSRDEEDFLVDLILPDGITADFSSNRQLWPRAIEAWNAIAKAQGETA